mmetsp:Transcript_39238/g.91687  ORF Transcript_39238/g.91687 Transcript_39238/m.91687 type:complete len:283 (-) Transcript_39238:690-1538(-)
MVHSWDDARTPGDMHEKSTPMFLGPPRNSFSAAGDASPRSPDDAPWRKRFSELSLAMATLTKGSGEEKLELGISHLPDDIVVLVLISESTTHSLRAIDITRLVCASKRFSFLVASDDLWHKMTSRFLSLVARLQPPSPPNLPTPSGPEASHLSLEDHSEGPPTSSAITSSCRSGLDVYREVSRKEKCRRCYIGFYRGANLSTCRSHPGVLISGHRSNGLSSTWTCCGMKGHANGCREEPHVPWGDTEDNPLTCGDFRPWSARVVTRPNSWVTCLDILPGSPP